MCFRLVRKMTLRFELATEDGQTANDSDSTYLKLTVKWLAPENITAYTESNEYVIGGSTQTFVNFTR